MAVCADVEAPEELHVEKRLERQHAVVLTHVAEKDFTFSDTLTLSPGREGAAEILTSRACGTVTEAKVVGSKLIFKGVFTASLLYRDNRWQVLHPLPGNCPSPRSWRWREPPRVPRPRCGSR